MTAPNEPARPYSAYFQGFTAREHAAIQLRVPDSGTNWLDAMIRTSLRQEFAKAAMQALLAQPTWPQSGPDMFARDAFTVADALLAELSKETK